MIHSPHHHTWRRIFSWTLIALYFVVVSILIPYALGYRFSMERGVFVYAGSVTLKVNAPDVVIAIDGVQLPDKRRNFINDAYHVTGLEPGEHLITLTASGYGAWERAVKVRSGISTEFWDITLPRDDYPRTIIAANIEPHFYLAPDNKRIAGSTLIDEITNVLAINTNDKTSTSIWQSKQWQVSDAHNMEWSPDSSLLLVPIVHNTPPNTNITEEVNALKTTDFAIITTKSNKTDTAMYPAALLSSLLPNLANVTSVRWSPKGNNTLVILAKDTLYELPITVTTLQKVLDKSKGDTHKQSVNLRKIADDVNIFTIANNQLYFLNKINDIIYSVANTGNKNKLPEIHQITTTPFAHADTDSTLLVYDKERIALIDDTDTLWLFDNSWANDNKQNNEPPFHRVGTSVRGAHFSGNGKKLLWWTDSEINVIFARQQKTQPVRSARDTLNITRLTQPATNIQWVLSDTHILYSVADRITLTALDQRGGQSINTISMALSASSVRIGNDNTSLYFIDTIDSKSTLISIPFIEKNGLF